MKRNKDKIQSQKSKKYFRNNLIIYSFLISGITIGLLELVFVLFLRKVLTGKELLYFVYIIPIMFGIITPLIHIFFRKYYNGFAIIEESLGKVADGDFSVRITNKANGAFENSFINFNKMVEELNNNEMLKEDFIHNFSHEFKTPVASIKGFADLLLEEDLSKEEHRKYLSIISTEAERLRHLSETILFFSNINTDTIMKDKTEFDLGEQIKNCVAMLDNQIFAKNIEISAEIPNVEIRSNSELLQEVWLNIIGNAIKFSNVNGKVEIVLKTTISNAVVTISDNGIGMTEKEKSLIFTQYYQADTSHKSAGFGLGLSIASKIIALAGGTIEVESVKNKGSIFTVSIPLNNSIEQEIISNSI